MAKMHWDHQNTNVLQRLAGIFGLMIVSSVTGLAVLWVVVEFRIFKNFAILALAFFIGGQLYVDAWNKWSPWAPSPNGAKEES